MKAEEIEPKVADILETLLKNDKLKYNRWLNVTETVNLDSEIPKIDISEIRDKLKINQEIQSKLVDGYLKNLFSEEVFKHKNEDLKKEEEEFKKFIALQEIREIEKEQSRDYTPRVEQFISDYNPDKKHIDSLPKNKS